MYQVIVVGLAVVLIYCFCYESLKEYYRFVKLLRALPSPKGKPWIGHLASIAASPVERFRIIRRWCIDMYPIFTISAGPYISVQICGPEEVETILSATKHLSKNKVYDFLNLWMGEGLLTSSGSKWHLRRKILTPTFHFGILQKFLNIFNGETRKMVQELDKETYKEYTTINGPISNMTLNTIIETSMGFSSENENSESRRYRKAVYEVGELISYRISRPWYYKYYPWYISPHGSKETELIKVLHQFTEKVIAMKAQNFQLFEDEDIGDTVNKRKKMAMLDLLLNMKTKEGIIDDIGIRDEVNTFMFEGHDTTAVSLGFTLMLLANHKTVQDTIVEEMSQIMPNWDRHPTYNELQELNYMERCIKESLRLYPSVPFIGRILSEDVVTAQGYVLPKAAECLIHIYDIHRNPNIWNEPDKFDPDRFLPENCHNRHPFSYIPFSAGSRNCIGQRFAILEIKAALCGILKKFELQPVDTPDSIRLIQDLVLRTKDNIKVKFVKRKYD